MKKNITLDILELIASIVVCVVVGAIVMYLSMEGELMNSYNKNKQLQAELNSSSSCTDLFMDGNGELFYIEHIQEKAR